jgi:hypothetical protein
MFHLTPFVGLWAVISAVTLGLAIYRKFVSAGEQDIIYLGTGEEGKIPEQQALAQRLLTIDLWGKTLTVVVLISGLALAVAYLYGVWVESAKL